MPNPSDRDRESELPEVDMSPAAVDRRLDTVQSLYELMVELRGARVVGPVKDRPRRP